MVGSLGQASLSSLADAVSDRPTASPSGEAAIRQTSRNNASQSSRQGLQEPMPSGAVYPVQPTDVVAALASHGQDSTMLQLLHSLKSSPRQDSAADESKSKADLKAALEKLLKFLRQSELARSSISRRDTEGYISSLVKISPLAVTEINRLKRLLSELSASLAPGQRVHFQNESLLLLRQFVFPQDKVLVVFLTEHSRHTAPKAGNFHSHLTRRPGEYRHHHNGEQIGVPPGESSYEGGSLSNPVSPAFRYYHLATNQ